MDNPGDELQDIVQEIIAQSSKARTSGLPTSPFVLNAIKVAGSLIMLGSHEGPVTADDWPDSCDSLIQLLSGTPQPDVNVRMSECAGPSQELLISPRLLRFRIPPAKRAHQYFLSDVLPNTIPLARAQLL